MIVLATEHVEREREIQKEKKRSRRVENATPDLYCQEAVRTGHVAARVARSKLAERGKREERKRKKKLIGSGDRYANSDRSEVDA